MKVVVKNRSDKALEECDYQDRIEIDGKKEFSVGDGEPEDCNLGRNFNDCFHIGVLMEKAFEAGKRGENFQLLYDDLPADE